MKAIINIIFLFPLLLITGFLTAQEVDNPQEMLVNKEWYVTKLEISGEEHLPSNDPEFQGGFHVFETSNSSEFDAVIYYCEYCSIDFIFKEDNKFFANILGCLAQNFCPWDSYKNEFSSLYLWEFWDEGTYPLYFYFSITETEENQQLIITNDNGDKAYFQNEPYLSVDKNRKINFVLYPNPTTDFVRLSGLDKLTTVKLFTISGKQVLSQTMESSVDKIDLTGLTSGIYFYQINADDSSEIQLGKIIKD